MHVFFIRTRLQCLISMHIRRTIANDGRYVAIFMYRNTRIEDSSLTYELYGAFEHKSKKSLHIVESDGIFPSFLSMFFWTVRSSLTGGSCFLASIDSLPAVLALRLWPFARLETFDDGSANILASSKYFNEQNDQKNGLKAIISRLLFPKGWAHWARQFTRTHHTIYRHHRNIVEPSRLNILEWDWTTLLIPDDLLDIPDNVCIITLGTCFEDFHNHEHLERVARKFADKSDLYIKHPRERSDISGERVKSFRSPAESIIVHVSNKRPVKVFHFNSSTAYALNGINRIEFSNIVDFYNHYID